MQGRTALGAMAARARDGDSDGEEPLQLTLRLRDGRELQSALPAARHRSIHLGLLHAESRGFLELAAGRRERSGELDIYTRRFPDHFLPAGASGDPRWLERVLALADRHLDDSEELFVGVAARSARRANKEHVHWSSWCWLDLDGEEHLGRLQALLARAPCHLLISSAGSGGLHAYWRLSRALPARTVITGDGRRLVNPAEVREASGEGTRTRLTGFRDPQSGAVLCDVRTIEWIERANLRLVHALGYVTRGGAREPVADAKCVERARVMRLAGSRNGKTGRYARIVRADFALPAYSPTTLLGSLEDAPQGRPRRRVGLRRLDADPYRLIPAATYFPVLAGVEVPAYGNVCCPVPNHEDRHPSCSVGDYGWKCFGCGAGGTIYDLASALSGGPTGEELSSRWRELSPALSERLREAFGEARAPSTARVSARESATRAQGAARART